jgi:hypothetical protein
MKRQSYKGANAANKAKREDTQMKLAREADGTQPVMMTLDEAATIHEAMVEARHLLDRVVDPLLGGGCGALHPVTKVGHALTKAERLLRNAMMLRRMTPDQLDDEASYEGKFYSERRRKTFVSQP